ncbi:MAG: hypothetical protein N2572_09680 [Syntrophales bacterium]|nr:hypothetical protein [Syntrophales bacterium]
MENRRWVVLAIVALSLWSTSAFSSGEEIFFLQVKDCREGRVYYHLPIRRGAEISIHLLHSYDRLPYWELYEIYGEGKFNLIKMGGKSLLNGQGFFYQGYRNLPDGTWEIGNVNEIVDQISFFMGTKGDADHKVIVGEMTLTLSDRILPGKLICLSLLGRKDISYGEK